MSVLVSSSLISESQAKRICVIIEAIIFPKRKETRLIFQLFKLLALSLLSLNDIKRSATVKIVPSISNPKLATK